MRLASIKAEKVKPIELFQVWNLSEVVVFAGPNGVGKSRLIKSILEHFRNPSAGNISLQIEATDATEEKAWGKKALNTSVPNDCRLLQQVLHQSRRRKNFRSSILNFESDRSIQQINPYQFSWQTPDPWEEQINWDFALSSLRNRFQDTVHTIFRKIQSLESQIAKKARQLKGQGQENMPLDFPDPLEPFKGVFAQLLAPKILLDADVQNQRLTYQDDGQIFGLDSLSSGEREVLNITFDFVLRSPSHCIIFFDEPELHLHPELSYRLLNTLRSIGTRNQFILCTHSPDIISATLDQSVIFVAPKTGAGANQAVAVKEDDDTNQALRLLGHSVGIVALGKKIVLIEGISSSLDKQLYGSLLKSKFPSLVLVPSGGKQTISSFHSVIQNVLDKALWGVDFFMLCDRDALPWGANTTDLEGQSKGKLRLLPKYHLENFFLDENILAQVFERLEPDDSWLRSPQRIRQELSSLAQGLVSYTVALLVSREFRLRVGNVDLMPKACNEKSEDEIISQFIKTSEDERSRVIAGLDEKELSAAISKYFKELNEYLASDDNRWKDMIPGKPLLAKFASLAKIDSARLKNAYIHCAENANPSPFQEIHNIFESFAKA